MLYTISLPSAYPVRASVFLFAPPFRLLVTGGVALFICFYLFFSSMSNIECRPQLDMICQALQETCLGRSRFEPGLGHVGPGLVQALIA